MRRALGLAEPAEPAEPDAATRPVYDETVRPFDRAEPDDPEKYQALPVEFTWRNDEWAREHLPSVRSAAWICQADWRRGDWIVGRMLARGGKTLLSTLDDLKYLKQHLRTLADLVEAAEARLLLSARRVAASTPDAPEPARPTAGGKSVH